MSTGLRRPAAAPALALAAGLLVAGCGQGQPGAAAVVGDERVGVEELQESTRELLDAAGLPPQAAAGAAGADLAERDARLQREVLMQLVLDELMERAAARNGVAVTEGQVDTLIADLEQRVGGPQALDRELLQVPVPPGRKREFLSYVATGEALAAKLVPGDAAGDPRAQQERVQAVQRELVRSAEEAGVQVNPRYGTWRPDQLEIEGSLSGGLAKTAQELLAQTGAAGASR